MSNDNKTETSNKTESDNAVNESVPDNEASDSTPGGPKFTESPDPLAGVRKGFSDAMASMEGKTVSMKMYVGTIIAVVLLMMLARCGG